MTLDPQLAPLPDDPSDADLDRLDAALSVGSTLLPLAPPLPHPARVRAGEVRCLHCGYRWLPRVPHPQNCAMCHTAAWDHPPKYRPSAAPHPDALDTHDFKGRNARRAARKRRTRLEILARQCGMQLVPRGVPTPAPVPAPLIAAAAAPLRRTVPPPPGLDDVETRR